MRARHKTSWTTTATITANTINTCMLRIIVWWKQRIWSEEHETMGSWQFECHWHRSRCRHRHTTVAVATAQFILIVVVTKNSIFIHLMGSVSVCVSHVFYSNFLFRLVHLSPMIIARERLNWSRFLFSSFVNKKRDQAFVQGFCDLIYGWLDPF